MTKAMLVVDMPEDCWDCHIIKNETCAGLTIQGDYSFKSIREYNKGKRPSWCPLKELPQNEDIERVVENIQRLWIWCCNKEMEGDDK